MKRNTLLSDNIAQADEKDMYDQTCKRILSNKIILAWIMKDCISEYQDLEVNDIASKYIEGVPDVGKANVVSSENEVIHGLPNEEVGSHGEFYYDIHYRALAPIPSTDEFTKLIINIEAQNKYNPGYPLVKRGAYYASSMISGQYGTVFKNSNYQKIQKAVSIWICRDVAKYRENTIASYDVNETIIAGNVREKKADYDLLSIVMICLGRPKDEQQPNILKMLNTLLSKEVRAAEKIEFLETEFKIPATENLKKDVETMCNLSEGIEQEGIRKGMETGIKTGMKKGDFNRAKKMLEDGLSLDFIKRYTDLSVGEIKKLSLNNGTSLN